MGPSTAQTIFSSVPLWSAVLAASVLRDEAVGPFTWLGGGAIVAAGLLSTS